MGILLVYFPQLLISFLLNIYIMKEKSIKVLVSGILMVLILAISVIFTGRLAAFPVVTLYLGLFGFNYLWNKTFSLSVTLASIIMIINIVSDHITTLLLYTGLFGINTNTFNELTYLAGSIHLIVWGIIATTVVIFFKKLYLSYFQNKIVINQRMNRVMALLTAVTTLIMISSIFIQQRSQANSIEIAQINSLFLMSYFIFSLIVFAIFILNIQKDSKIKIQQTELKTLMEYTDSLEYSYNEIRKFRHDYQNILSSIESYLDEKDLVGLQKYYYDQIKGTRTLLNEGILELSDMHNIKLKELKGILSVKLLLAQKLKIKITLEVKDEIALLPINSIDLVRMIGVIMDNAIEESIEIESPEINVAIMYREDSVLIVIVNEKRTFGPKLHEINTYGSTKGVTRGTGLKNLKEITNKYDHISLGTKMMDTKFIQEIDIHMI